MTDAGPWTDGSLPPNVRAGAGTVITGSFAFKRFHSALDPALVIGANCTMDGVQFALGEKGAVVIGDDCYFTNAVLLAELNVRIGSHVAIGWNATIADTDFHPLDPAARIDDSIAVSPASDGRKRPPLVCAEVVIDDDVWIGPNAAILKGVRIGAGAFVEPGSVVTSSVPPGARVLGNPAVVVGEVPS